MTIPSEVRDEVSKKKIGPKTLAVSSVGVGVFCFVIIGVGAIPIVGQITLGVIGGVALVGGLGYLTYLGIKKLRKYLSEKNNNYQILISTDETNNVNIYKKLEVNPKSANNKSIVNSLKENRKIEEKITPIEKHVVKNSHANTNIQNSPTNQINFRRNN